MKATTVKAFYEIKTGEPLMPSNKEIRSFIMKEDLVRPSQGTSHQMMSIHKVLNAIAHHKELNKQQIRYHTGLSPVTVKRVLALCEKRGLVNKEVRAHNEHVYRVVRDEAKQFLISLWAWRTVKNLRLLVSATEMLNKVLADHPIIRKGIKRFNKTILRFDKYRRPYLELSHLYRDDLSDVSGLELLTYVPTYEKYPYEVQFLVKRDRIHVLDAIKKVEQVEFSPDEKELISKLRQKVEGVKPRLGTMDSWKDQERLLRYIKKLQ